MDALNLQRAINTGSLCGVAIALNASADTRAQHLLILLPLRSHSFFKINDFILQKREARLKGAP